jgi:hypothetical protein
LRRVVEVSTLGDEAGGVEMRLALASVALMSSISISLPSLAAKVESMEGRVWINRGKGYQRLTAPSHVKAGDVIMAGVGSGAEIVYDDICTAKVRSGAEVTVTREPPCETSSAMMYLGAGSLKDAPPVYDTPPPLVDARPDYSVGPALLAGGLVVGGVVAAVLLLNDDDDDDKPASP